MGKYFILISDPVVVCLALDIFKELSQNPNTLAKLQQRLVPTLVSILNAPPEKVTGGNYNHKHPSNDKVVKDFSFSNNF